jgi:transcriptional regulator with XRE-family HTH domain
MFANVRSSVGDMSFTSPVTQARENANLTKAQLARAIGVSRSLITEIEAGTRNITEENLQKIAKECGCEPKDLIAEVVP